ncbi:MAG: penicillin-binding protein 2 [Desulfobacterales bacterium]|nr:MAG: penicillin-binding protein 2 [Desulfobacterales bacterium]
MNRKYINLRIILVGSLFLGCFGVISAKAVYLQLYRSPWLSQKAYDLCEKSWQATGKRGTIYDRHRHAMAVSIDVTSIAAYPAQIQDAPATAKALAKVLNMRDKQIKRRLTSKKTFVWIKRQATPKETKAVKALGLEGVGFVPEHSRFYPNRTLAAQALGFTGLDGKGLEGLEFVYEEQLRGPQISFKVFKDALGNGFRAEQRRVASTQGHNIVLTIDRTIQFITESALQEAVTDASAHSGMAIVMAPQTGAVLALAHFPFFNPNTYADFDKASWRNRAITDAFEPGSTLKVFSAAAAVESGKISRNSIFFCENGTYRVGRNVVHDHTPHGWLSLQQIIKYSSNIGAIKIGEQIGPQRLYEKLRGFGFGVTTGIDCPGETAGSLAHYSRWSHIDTGAISFGHGISVSAIQLITALAAIANDGVLMQPYIVEAVVDQNGSPVASFGPRKVRQVISAQSAAIVKKMLRSVTQPGGTGVNAALDGYTVCGKTGTARKIDGEGRYTHTKHIASFIGFVPAENPAVAILVVIDEPQHQPYGGVVAAPAFRQIAHETLNYLNVPPQKGSEQFKVSRENEALG